MVTMTAGDNFFTSVVPVGKKDTHGNQTLALAKIINSKHDQVAIWSTYERDCAIFINKKGRLAVGTMHFIVPIAKGEARGLRLCNV